MSTKTKTGHKLLAAAAILAATTIVFGQNVREPGPHLPSQELKSPFEMDEASVRQGKQVYTRYCVSCHGVDGKGKTDMAETLPTPPRDLTAGEWKYGGTDGEVFSIIRDGTQHGMPPFADKLNEQRLWQVVHYLRTIGPEPGIDQPAVEEVPENPIPYDRASVARGKQFYAQFCVKCHGDDGRGDTEMREFLSTHPSDLTNDQWTYGDRDGDIFLIIKNGTEYDMEAFADRLSDDRIWHIVNYLRDLSSDDEE
jgi:mono/diheme cytochrome c family protein